MANTTDDDDDESALRYRLPHVAGVTLPRAVTRAELSRLLGAFHREPWEPLRLGDYCLVPGENYSGLDFGELEGREFDFTAALVNTGWPGEADEDEVEWQYAPPRLVNARFSEGVWNGAIFGGADLTAASLEHASFVGATFLQAELLGPYGSYSDFARANLGLARCCHAHFVGTNFTKARLVSTDFSHAFLMDAVFDGALLTGANLTGANCTGASFRGATLEGVDFSGAVLLEVDFTGARWDEEGGQERQLSRTRWAMEWAGRPAPVAPPLPEAPPFDYNYEEDEPLMLGDPYGGGGYLSDEEDTYRLEPPSGDWRDDPFLPPPD